MRKKQHFGLLDQTVSFFQQIITCRVIVTSFKGEHAFQAPSVVSSEVETHSHKNVSEAVQIVWRFKSTTLGVLWWFYKYVNRSITWRLAHTSPVQNPDRF